MLERLESGWIGPVVTIEALNGCVEPLRSDKERLLIDYWNQATVWTVRGGFTRCFCERVVSS